MKSIRPEIARIADRLFDGLEKAEQTRRSADNASASQAIAEAYGYLTATTWHRYTELCSLAHKKPANYYPAMDPGQGCP